MKKLTKLLTIILTAFLFTNVFAMNSTVSDALSIDSKSYDKTTGEFKVEGSTTYDEVMVSLFDGNELVSFRTVSKKSNKYSVKFFVEFNEAKTITIKVGDIESKDFAKTTLDVEPTEKPKTITDDGGNRLTILGDGTFENGQGLDIAFVEGLDHLQGEEKNLFDFIQSRGFKANQKIVAIAIVDLNDHSPLPETTNGYKLFLAIPEEKLQGYHKLYIARLLDEMTPTIETAKEFNFDSAAGGVELTLNNIGTYLIYDETEEVAPDAEVLTNAVISVTKGAQNSAIVSLDKYYKNQTYTLYKNTTTNKKKWKKVGVFTGDNYSATGLTFGQKTYFKVVVAFNGKTVETNTVNIKVYPDAVTNLKVTSAGATNIKTEWDKASYTGYEVQRSTKPDSGFKKVAYVTKSKTTTYNNKKLKNATVYYYRVRAYKNVSGKKVFGPWSNTVSATTGPAQAKVATIKAVNYNTIGLELKAAKTAATYKIQRSTKKNKGFTDLAVVSDTSYNDTVSPGVVYYYRTKACNVAGVCGSWSKVVSKKAVLGKTTVSLIAVAEPDGVKTTFTLTAVDGAEGYEIQRSAKKNSGFKKLLETSELTVQDVTAALGKTQYYRVRAYRTENGKKGYSAWSKVVSKKVTLGKTSLTATASVDEQSVGKVALTLTAVEGAKGYEIQKSTKSSRGFKSLTDTTELSFEDANVTTGKTYYYKARTYIMSNGKKAYTGWTKVFKVTVK